MGILRKVGALTNRSGRIATIDAVKAAPPPSPLAPIDLTDQIQVAAVMDLAARIGDILLSSGTSNRDTKAQIHAVTAAYGLLYCQVDITLNAITIFANLGGTDGKKTPVTVFRVVSQLTTDFSKLSAVDRLIRSIQAGATPPDVAAKILDDIYEEPASYGFKTALLGWGTMGAAVSVLLGGGWVVAVVSFLIAITIMAGSPWLAKHGLSPFFQNIFGGFTATFPTAIAYSIAQEHSFEMVPSQIIASGIVVMLAGLTLVQALQDGITGAPVTASARFFETLLLTGGIIAGVAVGIEFAQMIGITLPPLETANAPNYASVLVKCIAGGVASAAFAVACYAEIGSVIVSGVTAFAGSLFYYFVLISSGMGTVISVAMAAFVIGLAGGLMARRFLIPPLITAVAGITPMLPGLSIYHGMYATLNEQTLIGFTNMALAMSICSALAAGVVLGEWVARRLRRPPKINLYGAFRKARKYTTLQQNPHPDTQSFKVINLNEAVERGRGRRKKKP